jgi:hypothetical protein
MRRYPVVGAVWTAVGVLLAGAVVAYAGPWLGRWDVAVPVAALGLAGTHLARRLVIEVSPDGLARGLILGDAFVLRPTAIAWSAVVDVHTDWAQPGTRAALVTVVRARTGAVVRLSTTMGLATYWACLDDLTRRAPGAAWSGLTEATLASGPPGPRELLAALRTAAVLALILIAMVGVFHVWAQGKSSLARSLE